MDDRVRPRAGPVPALTALRHLIFKCWERQCITVSVVEKDDRSIEQHILLGSRPNLLEESQALGLGRGTVLRNGDPLALRSWGSLLTLSTPPFSVPSSLVLVDCSARAFFCGAFIH